MKAIEALKAKLKLIGATLDESCMDYALHCDAPKGYVWECNSHPFVTIQYANNSQSWLTQALKYAYAKEIGMGLRKVVDQDEIEEMRHNLDDDSWIAPADAPMRIEWPK